MVKTYQQRHPSLYDENGERKLSTYTCHNCGKIARGRFPDRWIGGVAYSYCSHKCYSEHLDKVIKEGEMTEIPEFGNEDEERAFWTSHDSIDYLDGAEQVTLEHIEGDITGSSSKFLCYEVQIPSHSVRRWVGGLRV